MGGYIGCNIAARRRIFAGRALGEVVEVPDLLFLG
jgi:hypothetical protein